MLTIDGAMGEGGGQILRSSLSLALCLGKPFRIENIRRARHRPGLRRQHLAAVAAATAISKARVSGAAPGARALSFVPGRIRPGSYRFSIGTAGSTILVLQTVLPALMGAPAPSDLLVEGGTHNPMAPTYDFLAFAFLPLLRRLGASITARLERPGFYPAGGGLIRVRIEPQAGPLGSLCLLERGRVQEMRCDALVANLPGHIAQRELALLRERLALDSSCLGTANPGDVHGRANLVTVRVAAEQVTEVFTGFGKRGLRAETVAGKLADEVRRYLAAGVPVGEHLADQLLLPLALAGGGAFRTLRPTEHMRTNVKVLKTFLDIPILCERNAEDDWFVGIGPGAGAKTCQRGH